MIGAGRQRHIAGPRVENVVDGYSKVDCRHAIVSLWLLCRDDELPVCLDEFTEPPTRHRQVPFARTLPWPSAYARRSLCLTGRISRVVLVGMASGPGNLVHRAVLRLAGEQGTLVMLFNG